MEKRQIIDYWLERMAKLNATIGIDSTESEVQKVKHEIKLCHERIKEIDVEFYNDITPYENKSQSTSDVF